MPKPPRFSPDTDYDGDKVLSSDPSPPAHERYRRLVERVVTGHIPRGVDFDACRAVLRASPSGEEAFTAMAMLLEGALADPSFDIGDTQLLVPLLKELAHGSVRAEELL
jgi:hypothetical protein